MKKLFLCLALILLVSAVLLPVSSFATTSMENEICDIVAKHDNVTKVKCVVYQRNCIVAIKTEKFVSHSEYDKFRQEICDEIMQKYSIDKVIVTRSPKAMQTIEQLEKMDEQERNETIQKLLDQYSKGGKVPFVKY